MKDEAVILISSDASSFRCRAVYNIIHTGESFNLDEMVYHINAEKILPENFSLNIVVTVSDGHVKLLSDNTTTVHVINNIHSNRSN